MIEGFIVQIPVRSRLSGRSWVRVLVGTWLRRTSGCILVGARAGQDGIYESGETMRQIAEHVDRVIQQDRARTEQKPWLPEETSIIIHISDPPAQEGENPQEEDIGNSP